MIWTKYACPWHRASGLMFICVPKVASTSMASVMLELNGIVASKVSPADIHRKRKSIQVNRDNGPWAFCASFTRNPFDRIYSVWKDKINLGNSTQLFRKLGGLSFEEFIAAIERDGTWADGHTARQSDFLINADGRQVPDFLGSFENLQTDWARLRGIFEFLPLVLPGLNRVPGGDYKKAYTPSLEKRVVRLYEEDFARFGYETTCG